MAAPRHPLRSHIVSLFRRGDLVSVHEAVLICDASRQAITKWLKAAGIDVEAHRLAYLARLRTKAQSHVDTLSAAPRLSAKKRWQEAQKAVRRFNAAHTAETRQP